MKNLSRRTLLLGTGAALGFAGARFASKSITPLPDAVVQHTASGSAVLNDASELSATPVHKHIIVSDAKHDLVDRLRSELEEARAEGRPINIGAARHSMGGQAIPKDGTAITLDDAMLEFDSANRSYLVHAGARWSQIIAALDPLGASPKVMQSNNDFGVAATFCVNAHGWPAPLGPMGATVKAIELMLPDGELMTASRDQNPEMFAGSMGGYGLTGAILSMEVEAEKNWRLEPTFEHLEARAFAPAFMTALQDPDVNMAYGRLNVDHDRFFQDALLITYRPAADQEGLPPAAGSGLMSHLARYVYRAQLGNDRMKRLRWGIETRLGPALAGASTRNSLINEPVATLDDRDPNRTDILHEYFVAPDRFVEFLELCRAVIPASYQEFLNVTLRYIAPDRESWLSYAPVGRIAAVMSFSQEKTARAEADMARMTRDLVEGMIAIGGSYYLPYRPHPTVDQFQRAYPRAAEFAAAKRALDPDLIFRNNLWDQYLGAL